MMLVTDHQLKSAKQPQTLCTPKMLLVEINVIGVDSFRTWAFTDPLGRQLKVSLY